MARGPVPALSAHRSQECAGFTLVELMVVLALVGLLGAAVLLAGPSPQAALAREADTLAARLDQARQEAILSARALRVQVDGEGYRFLVARSGGWQPLSGPPFEPTAWSAGIAPVPGDDGQPAWFAFDPIGTAEPASLVLGDGRGALEVRVDAGGSARVAQVR